MERIKLKLLIKKYWLRATVVLLTIYATVTLTPVITGLNLILFNGAMLVFPTIFITIIGALSYKISIFSIILSIFVLGIFNKIYRYLSVRKNTLKILKAEYGSGSLFIEITNKLNDAIEDNKLNIVLSNNIIGDPAPGIPKIGKIKYLLGNKKEEKTYNEGDTINLPIIKK